MGVWAMLVVVAVIQPSTLARDRPSQDVLQSTEIDQQDLHRSLLSVGSPSISDCSRSILCAGPKWLQVIDSAIEPIIEGPGIASSAEDFRITAFQTVGSNKPLLFHWMISSERSEHAESVAVDLLNTRLGNINTAGVTIFSNELPSSHQHYEVILTVEDCHQSSATVVHQFRVMDSMLAPVYIEGPSRVNSACPSTWIAFTSHIEDTMTMRFEWHLERVIISSPPSTVDVKVGKLNIQRPELVIPPSLLEAGSRYKLTVSLQDLARLNRTTSQRTIWVDVVGEVNAPNADVVVPTAAAYISQHVNRQPIGLPNEFIFFAGLVHMQDSSVRIASYSWSLFSDEDVELDRTLTPGPFTRVFLSDRALLSNPQITVQVEVTVGNSTLRDIVMLNTTRMVATAENLSPTLKVEAKFSRKGVVVSATATGLSLEQLQGADVKWAMHHESNGVKLSTNPASLSVAGAHTTTLSLPVSKLVSDVTWFELSMTVTMGSTNATVAGFVAATLPTSSNSSNVRVVSQRGEVVSSYEDAHFWVHELPNNRTFVWKLFEIQNPDIIYTSMGNTFVIPSQFLVPLNEYNVVAESDSSNADSHAMVSFRVAPKIYSGNLTFKDDMLRVRDYHGDSDLSPLQFTFWYNLEDGKAVPLSWKSSQAEIQLPRIMSSQMSFSVDVSDQLAQVAQTSADASPSTPNTLDCSRIIVCDDPQTCDRTAMEVYTANCSTGLSPDSCLSGVAVAGINLSLQRNQLAQCSTKLHPQELAQNRERLAKRLIVLLQTISRSGVLIRTYRVPLLHIMEYIVDNWCALPALPQLPLSTHAHMEEMAGELLTLTEKLVSAKHKSERVCLTQEMGQRAMNTLSALSLFNSQFCHHPHHYLRGNSTEPSQSELGRYAFSQQIRNVAEKVLLAVTCRECGDTREIPSVTELFSKALSVRSLVIRPQEVSRDTLTLTLAHDLSSLVPDLSPTFQVSLEALAETFRREDHVLLFSVVHNQHCSLKCDNIASPVVRLSFRRANGTIHREVDHPMNPPVLLTLPVDTEAANDEHVSCAAIWRQAQPWSNEGVLTYDDTVSTAAQAASPIRETCVLSYAPGDFALLRSCLAPPPSPSPATSPSASPTPPTSVVSPALTQPSGAVAMVRQETASDEGDESVTDMPQGEEELTLPDINAKVEWDTWKNLEWFGVLTTGVVMGIVFVVGMFFAVVHHNDTANKVGRSGTPRDMEQPPDSDSNISSDESGSDAPEGEHELIR